MPYVLNAVTALARPGCGAAHIAWARAVIEAAADASTGRAYVNFLGDAGAARRPTERRRTPPGRAQEAYDPTTCSGATRTSNRREGSAERAREHVGKLAARGHVELAKGAAEVRLDRLLGDEQRLGDLAVGLTRRPPAPPRAARSGSANPHRSARRSAGRTPIAASSARARRSSASAPQRDARASPPAAASARRCSLSGGAQGGAEIDEHPRVLEPAGGWLQHLERLPRGGRPARSRADQRGRAQGHGDGARRAERLRAAQLVGGEGARLLVRPTSASDERRRRSPGQHRRVQRAERRMVRAAGQQLLDRALGVARGGAQHARGVAQL